MAPQVGFEPTTRRLTADRSTTELLRNNGLMIAFTPLLLQGIGYLDGVSQAKVFYALKSQNYSMSPTLTFLSWADRP